MERIGESSKLRVLSGLSLGSRVAEDEVDKLTSYFVETDQWRRVKDGDIDIVFGAKGSGKSALHATLRARADALFDERVLVVSAENIRGATVFDDLVADPPASEQEFVGLWKLYVLVLAIRTFEEYGISSDGVGQVRDNLVAEGLLPEESDELRTVFSRLRDYARRIFSPESVQGGVVLDPAGNITGLTAKVTMGEPTAEQLAEGAMSLDQLLGLCDNALLDSEYSLWLLFDRLDVAFADSRDLEANALRALFKVYLDMLSYSNMTPKIFLRSDIWREVTSSGFREASHITRSLTISWTGKNLLHLLVKRLLSNEPLLALYSILPEDVLTSDSGQRSFFDGLVPDQIDTGRNPRTFEWMVGRVTDGNSVVAPRELIHLMSEARDQQVAALERGADEPGDGQLFGRQAIRDALPEVSRARLEQTVYAEYPHLRGPLEGLRGEKTSQSIGSLAAIWGIDSDVARSTADNLAEIGFFDRRGEKSSPEYWVPFLYRTGLEMVQGTAD